MTITFLDSLRLLPASLLDLSIAFSNNNKNLVKSSFDVKKVNKYNLLEHRVEATRYCLQDCRVLHHILKEFNALVYNNWQTVIWDSPTISSLALKVYRTKFITDGIIPQISGSIYSFIKQGLFGGATDMMIPFHFYEAEGRPIYGYDVNSLYASIMKDFELPAGDIHWFQGNILEKMPGVLAFCNCNVIAPKNLEHPFLPVHIGNKSVTGLGEFNGVYYSKEILHAISLGYKIEVVNGFYFTKAEKLFTNYVDSMYNLRLSFEKGSPMNYIAKLLMNSLFGRFALDDRYNKIKILDNKEFSKLIMNKVEYPNIKDYELYEDEKKVLVETVYQSETNSFSSNFENHMSSIGISAAITAEGRIFMSKMFKNNPDLELFYTDTDSIFVSKSPEEMNEMYPGIVDSKALGKLKHEYTIINAVFLAPKCYWMQLQEGNEVVKIKGVKKESLTFAMENEGLNFDTFKNLLVKDSHLEIHQEKWARDFNLGTINIMETTYDIKQNNNKREWLYDENGNCIDSKPIDINMKDWEEGNNLFRD